MLAGGVSGVEEDESSPSLDSESESSRLVLSTTTFFGVVSSAWMLVVRRRAKTSDTEKRNMSLAQKCAGYAVQIKGRDSRLRDRLLCLSLDVTMRKNQQVSRV